MAKNDPADANGANVSPNQKNKKDKEKKGGLLGKLILTVIFLAVIGIIVVAVFNPAGLRERYLRGVINAIPVVNTLLPAPAPDTETDPRSLMTNEELIKQLNSLQGEVDRLNNDKEDLTGRIGIYTAEIESLKAIEAQLDEFRSDKNKFDQMIAMNDPAAYANFYESISPENADILYREAIQASERAQELKRLTNTVSAMEERASAKMLETLMTQDMDLVILLLKNINTATAGAIIEAMSAENAAAVIRWMAPSAE